jgi:hypothetical protein
MGILRASALLALALLGTICGPAAVKAQLLPALIAPAGCGYILQVQQGDTCQGLADWAGISYTEFVTLNPLMLCGILNPVAGVLVCAGDKLSYCSNFYRTVAGDTCASVQSLGRVVGTPAAGLTCAAPLPADTEVCLAPAVNQCDVDSLCGVPLSASMKSLLSLIPDWCSVLKECKAPLSATTTNGQPSITATFTEVTPAIASVAGNEGHPEMRDFVKQSKAGPASLQIAFVPQSDGDSYSDFVISSGGSGRKLLATAARPGRPGYAPPRYY